MKGARKALSRALIVLAVAGLLAAPASHLAAQPAYAATKNVTAKMKKNKGIKSVCRDINECVQALANWDGAKKKTVKMTAAHKADIACLSAEFTRNNVVVYEDNYDDWETGLYLCRLKDSAMKKKYRQLFGASINVANAACSDLYVKKLGSHFYVPVGDWGEFVPAYAIKTIKKTGKNTYQIKIANQMRNDYGKRYNEGVTVISVKKNKKSSYGFVVTKFLYKRK